MSDVAHSGLPTFAVSLRWGARILSALILLFFGFFLVAHIVGDEGRSSRPLVANDYIGLTALIVSLAGLSVAWKWEFIGAVMTLVAFLIGVYANVRIVASPIAVIPLTACLFLLSWWMSKTRMD